MSDMHEKEYWKKVHELNSGRLTEQYMEKNFKEVKKLFIHDTQEFKFAVFYLISTFLILALSITLAIINECLFFTIMTGILSIIPAAYGAIGIHNSLEYVTVKVPLTDADKLLGD